MKKVQPLSKIIDSLFRDPKLRVHLQKGRVFGAWARVVGPQIAQISRPTFFKKGELFIRVNTPVWRNELTMMQTELIGKLNDEIGEKIVKQIIFR